LALNVQITGPRDASPVDLLVMANSLSLIFRSC